jgi:hypothetical protein
MQRFDTVQHSWSDKTHLVGNVKPSGVVTTLCGKWYAPGVLAEQPTGKPCRRCAELQAQALGKKVYHAPCLRKYPGGAVPPRLRQEFGNMMAVQYINARWKRFTGVDIPKGLVPDGTILVSSRPARRKR